MCGVCCSVAAIHDLREDPTETATSIKKSLDKCRKEGKWPFFHDERWLSAQLGNTISDVLRLKAPEPQEAQKLEDEAVNAFKLAVSGALLRNSPR